MIADWCWRGLENISVIWLNSILHDWSRAETIKKQWMIISRMLFVKTGLYGRSRTLLAVAADITVDQLGGVQSCSILIAFKMSFCHSSVQNQHFSINAIIITIFSWLITTFALSPRLSFFTASIKTAHRNRFTEVQPQWRGRPPGAVVAINHCVPV